MSLPRAPPTTIESTIRGKTFEGRVRSSSSVVKTPPLPPFEGSPRDTRSSRRRRSHSEKRSAHEHASWVETGERTPQHNQKVAGTRAELVGTSECLPSELSAALVLAATECQSLSEVSQLVLRKRGLRTIGLDCGELVRLRVLSLSHNALACIGPLSELPSLVELNVNHNCIEDLQPVFNCEGLEVLLAANNRIVSLNGLDLQQLRRISLFSNSLDDWDSVLFTLSGLQRLREVDLAGNPCVGPSERFGLVRAIPNLTVIDGDRLMPVDRQLAEEYFACAKSLGFDRPRTAPVFRHRQPPGPIRSQRGEGDTPQKVAAHIEALRVRIHTVQVDCANLKRHIASLATREPQMGTYDLRERLEVLESQNREMHAQVAENQKLKIQIAGLEALALRPRPRSSRSRSGPSAAVEAVLEMLPSSRDAAGSEPDLRARNHLLRQRIDEANLHIERLRNETLSSILSD